MHRWSRGGSGTRDNDSGSGEGAIADTSEAQALLDAIPAAVPVLHRGSRGGNGPSDKDSGRGEGAIADTSEAQAAAQTVPAAEAMSRTLPPPLFPLSRQASGGHYDDSRKSLFHCLTKWSMLVGLTTWSMLGGGVGGIVASTETPSDVECG